MIGHTISHYEVTEQLGQGGMGVVYKARDLRLGRFVAMKFLPRAVDALEEDKQRFILEARAASALDHPNICTIHEIDETEDGQMFIVMGYYQGETLREKVTGGPLPMREALDFAKQTCRGIGKAHREKIVHRDIKPANIIVTTEGVVKILDFGLARLSGHTQISRPGMRLGTASYMSPEQAKGDPLDHRTDIWAFGVVLYELLSGRRPFEGTHDLAVIYSVVNDDPEPLRDISTTVPAALENIVIKALSKDPDDRYDSIDDVLADLEGVVPEDDSEVTRSIPAAEIADFSPIKPEKKSKLPFAAAAAVAVGVAAALGYFLTTDSASVDTASAPPELTLPDEGAASAAPGAPFATSPAEGESAAPPPTAEPPRPVERASAAEPPPIPRAAASRTEPVPPPAASAPATVPAAVEQPPAAAAPEAGDEAAESISQARVGGPPTQPAVAEPTNGRVQELTDWTSIRDSTDIAAFEEFLAKHPEGTLRREAEGRIDDLAWQQARGAGTSDAVSEYLGRYPDGGHVAEARSLLAELKPPAAPQPELQPRSLVVEVSEEDRIKVVLRDLGRAYEAKDINRVRALWPGLTSEQGSRLAGSFKVARSIGYELETLGPPAIESDEASIRCRRIVRYSDDRGDRKPVESEVTVKLRKRDSQWLIHSIR